MIGAVRGVDPETGRRFDDTKYLLDSIGSADDADRDGGLRRQRAAGVRPPEAR